VTKVLSGCRVIDHGTFITGPYAAMLLGDLGAEVIKIERPGSGDPFRSFDGGLYSAQFRAFNGNKKSIALDLEQESERELLAKLIADADVYIENFRPGVAERLGVGPEAMRSRNSKLIYCAISGFGQDGPYAHRPVYDTVAQSMSGYLSMFVSLEDPRVVGPAVADGITGLYAACGILGALYERDRTGVGRLLEVSMIESMMHFSIEQFAHHFVGGVDPGPGDRARLAQSYALNCADDKLIALHLSSVEKFWQGLVAAIDRPELASDPRFATRMQRVHNQIALQDTLRPIFRLRSRVEWIERLERTDVPYAPIFRLSETLVDEQVRHLGIERQVLHPTEGVVKTIRRPMVYDRDRAGIEIDPAPVLNEQGAAIRAAYAAEPSRPHSAWKERVSASDAAYK
jgi:crotonobetainyl-CoA:carnitine CoA-transferase CaiB-like acyl-CoA transferase